MSTVVRIATFNVENLDDKPDLRPSLAERIAVLRPQLVRVRADVLCLQEVHGQEASGQPRSLAALDELVKGTVYETFHRVHTRTQQGEAYDVRNLVVLSRFPVLEHRQLKNTGGAPAYQKVTAQPPETVARPVEWERPILVPCENTIPESSRYSLFHLGRGLMLDHIFVSRPFAAFYRGAEIHNEILPDESGAFRTDVTFPESDHAPVVAEFVIP